MPKSFSKVVLIAALIEFFIFRQNLLMLIKKCDFAWSKY